MSSTVTVVATNNPEVTQGTGESALEQLFKRGAIDSIDLEVGLLLSRLEPSDDPIVGLTAALASRATQAGHVCLDLEVCRAQPLLDENEQPVRLELPERDEWARRLRSSRLVSEGAQATPLVLRPEGVYLQRYFQYERRLIHALQTRLRHNRVALAPSTLELLKQLFASSEANDLQRRAAYIACTHKISLISGGPGTGKTSTVARVLALLQHELREQGQSLRLLLLAPTGKAATRLSESLLAGLDGLPLAPETLSELRVTPATIHRALGYQARNPTRFRHNAESVLPHSVVVVDEAAMVDLALMTKLVEAVDPASRLILLGDRNQLASVEAGAVFGDLCERAGTLGYSATLAADLLRDLGDQVTARKAVVVASGHSEQDRDKKQRASKTQPPQKAESPEAVGILEIGAAEVQGGNLDAAAISDCTVHFEKSYRYAADGLIARFARAIREQDIAMAFKVLEQCRKDRAAESERELNWVELPLDAWNSSNSASPDSVAYLEPSIVSGYQPLAAATTPTQRLAALNAFRVLSPHRKGLLGVEGLNRLAEAAFAQQSSHGRGGVYVGQPILITENDYTSDLYNGDVGVIDAAAGGKLVACFAQAGSEGRTLDGGVRMLSLARLPAFTTVFAMTVHKSQGSEFDRVVVVLPHAGSPLLNRELLYTAVTRAKRQVTLISSRRSLEVAVERRIERSSGLKTAFGG